jgi:hypothetical protein
MPDYFTILSSLFSSMGGAAAAGWLSKQLISDRLKRNLEAYKNSLNQDLENYKSALEMKMEGYKARLDIQRDEHQASLHRQIETVLGNDAADRQYVFEARKRLYTAIGPLRFQLLLACRQAAHRIEGHGAHPYPLDLKEYYGQNMLYRILRPLAISDLIERHIAYADFSVDPSAIQLLRFRLAASLAWSGDRLVLDHPKVNWTRQEQHVVADRLAAVAEVLIQEPQPGNERVLRFREFEASLNTPDFVDRLDPFPSLFNEFDPVKKPILWLRLVCFGYICNEFVRSGSELGFEQRRFPAQEMLLKSKDQHIEMYLKKYEQVICDICGTSL